MDLALAVTAAVLGLSALASYFVKKWDIPAIMLVMMSLMVLVVFLGRQGINAFYLQVAGVIAFVIIILLSVAGRKIWPKNH